MSASQALFRSHKRSCYKNSWVEARGMNQRLSALAAPVEDASLHPSTWLGSTQPLKTTVLRGYSTLFWPLWVRFGCAQSCTIKKKSRQNLGSISYLIPLNLWATSTLLGEGKHSSHWATSIILAELQALYPLGNKLSPCRATRNQSTGLQVLYPLSDKLSIMYAASTLPTELQPAPPRQCPLERITLRKWGAEKEGARNSQIDEEGMVDFLQDCLLILHVLLLLQADDIRDAHNLQGIVPPACLLLHQVHAAKCSGALRKTKQSVKSPLDQEKHTYLRNWHHTDLGPESCALRT